MYGAWRLRKEKRGTLKERIAEEMDMSMLRDESEAL